MLKKNQRVVVVVVVDKKSFYYGFKGIITYLSPYGEYNVEGEIPEDCQEWQSLSPEMAQIFLDRPRRYKPKDFVCLFRENEIESMDAS